MEKSTRSLKRLSPTLLSPQLSSDLKNANSQVGRVKVLKYNVRSKTPHFSALTDLLHDLNFDEYERLVTPGCVLRITPSLSAIPG